jgi:hypothetical protein
LEARRNGRDKKYEIGPSFPRPLIDRLKEGQFDRPLVERDGVLKDMKPGLRVRRDEEAVVGFRPAQPIPDDIRDARRELSM